MTTRTLKATYTLDSRDATEYDGIGILEEDIRNNITDKINLDILFYLSIPACETVECAFELCEKYNKPISHFIEERKFRCDENGDDALCHQLEAYVELGGE